jgi:hypothetical protein
VFEHFQSLALRLNNEHPNCLKAIHSDNGTEFRNASFDQFCLEHGVDQQFFALCVPQQNRVVEQKNHTLVEMARTMLDKHKTPRRFWANAIINAYYISNQFFLCSILNLTPFELRIGRKWFVFHLRPFSCKCFILKHGNLDQFESHSSDGILLGYTPHGRCYKVFNLETNTVVESYNVTFDKIVPCPHDLIECAGDKEMEENNFIGEELQRFDCDEDEPLLLHHHPSLFLLSNLKQRVLRLLPLPQQQWRHHGLWGRSSPSRELPLTFRRHIHLNRS